MALKAKRLIRELQEAVYEANDGEDLWVGLVDMDDGEKYGHAEAVSVHMSEDAPVFGMPTVVITYN